jgi:1-aminocyclopropane-1-carboxylate deaminase/D-cysteine desulfhydrase-like pyridoxal-dependent ACC family enzyme
VETHLRSIQRIPIAHIPKPIQELPRLPLLFTGPEIFDKSDGLMVISISPNKVGKLGVANLQPF